MGSRTSIRTAKASGTSRMRLVASSNGLSAPFATARLQPKISLMAAAFITCTTPRSMSTEDATAWLERRAERLRRAEPAVDISVRELRPRRRDPVWLLHVAGDTGGDPGWDEFLAGIIRDLRRLGMRPTVSVAKRPRERVAERSELARAA